MNEHQYARKNPKKRRERHNCCVPQCSEVKTPSNHLFSAPADPNRRKTWAVAIKTAKALGKRMQICSKHFVPDDYIKSRGSKPTLKRTAVPSQCLPVRSLDKAESSPVKKLKAARADRAQKRALWTDADSTDATSDNNEEESKSTEDVDELMGALNEEEWEDVPVVSEGDKKIMKSCGTQADHESDFVQSILSSDKKLFSATGIHSVQLLRRLTESFERIAPDSAHGSFSLSTQERIVMTMMKVKLGISFSSLAVFYDVTIQTCCNYFYDTVVILSKILKCMVFWPEKEEILKNMPKCFGGFKNTRVVLDCFELPVEKPKCVRCRVRLFSQYKGGYTIKVLLACAPSGLITHYSKSFGGRVSDKAITEHSGIYRMCDPGDGIMVDKGFLIEDECHEHLLTLIRPPFMRKNRPFSRAESVQCARIARARVHVERVIQRVREYNMMKCKLPWSITPYFDDIATIVFGLVNLSNPILALNKY